MNFVFKNEELCPKTRNVVFKMMTFAVALDYKKGNQAHNVLVLLLAPLALRLLAYIGFRWHTRSRGSKLADVALVDMMKSVDQPAPVDLTELLEESESDEEEFKPNVQGLVLLDEDEEDSKGEQEYVHEGVPLEGLSLGSAHAPQP